MRDPRRRRFLVWAIIALGLAGRLVIAIAGGASPDTLMYRDVVTRALVSDPLHVYRLANAGANLSAYPNPGAGPAWAWPPGFFPWLWLSHAANRVGLPFVIVSRLPAIAADAALAWIAQREVGRRGHGPTGRLIAAALVSFGPAFVVPAASFGHIDSVAIVPAVAAVVLWERAAPGRRAVVCGGLIGVAACMKTVPLLLVLALAPTAVSPREIVRLVAAAVSLPVVALLPFVIADPAPPLTALRYHGVPGSGGLSVVLQPGLGVEYVHDRPYHYSSIGHAILHAGPAAGALAIIAVTLVVVVPRRLPAATAAALLWLTVFVFTGNFSLQYLVWLLPFMLLCGWWPAALALQLCALPALAESVVSFPPRAPVYVGSMILLWAAFATALAAGIARPRLLTRPAADSAGALAAAEAPA